jgi:hypothetical protein
VSSASIKLPFYLLVLSLAISGCVSESGGANGSEGAPSTTRAALSTPLATWKNLWNAAPPDTIAPAVTYDRDRHTLVAFGGLLSTGNGYVYQGDTWEWNGPRAEWKKTAASGATPPARNLARLVYDPIHKTSVLMGGTTASNWLADLWDWNGTTATWTQRTPIGAAPSLRAWPYVAWDSDRQRVVLFGGLLGQTYYNDLWEWDDGGGAWTNRTPAVVNVAPRQGSAMAYDSVRKKMVLYGGNDTYDQTWEWDGGAQTWTQGPSIGARINNIGDGSNNQYNLIGLERMAFDESRATIVLPVNDNDNRRLFEYHPTPAPAKWVEVMTAETIGPTGGEVTYDPDRKVVACLSGGIIWEYDGATGLWSQRTLRDPLKRTNVAVAADGGAGTLRMFGGTSNTNVIQNDFWEWSDSDGGWNQHAATTDPWPPAQNGGLVYDSKRDRTMLFVKSAQNNTPINDAWLWSATASAWTHVTTSGVGPFYVQTGFYDAARDKVVFVGNASAATTSIWELDPATLAWTLRPNTTAGLPTTFTNRTYPGLAYDSDRSKLLFVGGHSRDQYGSVTYYDGIWEWDAATNTYNQRQPLAGGPAPTPRIAPSVSYDSLRHRVVMLGPNDSWEWDPLSGAWTDTTSPGRPAGLYPWSQNWVSQFFDAKNGRTLLLTGSGPDSFWEYRSTSQPVGAVTVVTNQSSYAAGSSITVTYSGLPGNPKDWIAIAPAGSPLTSYVAYAFTNGQQSGTVTFTAPAGGTYVVRALANNKFDLLGESAVFGVPGVSVDRTSYAPGQTITVTYAGLPGNQKDWIAIAPAGSATTSYIAYVFTNGQKDGTATFTAPDAGTYVARAMPNNTFTLLAESARFSITSVSTDRTSYAAGATITVTYSGLPGNPQDWIAIAPAGSPMTSYVAYAFTNGQQGGTVTFTAPAAGTYVARAFPNNTFVLFAESAAFGVPGVSIDRTSYTPGQTITVTYAGLPGNLQDWIAIAPAGAAPMSYVAYAFTNGQQSGTATFTAPAAGTYVARAFPNNTFTLLAESASFSVTSVTTDRASYAPGSTITVTYSGLPGNLQDWIAIAPAGSATTSYVAYFFTNGQQSGTATFTAPAAGSYVVRAFPNNTFAVLVESAPFSVTGVTTDRASYAPGQTITVTYGGLPGNLKDWIAIAPAGSPTTSYVAYVFTNGQQSGTATFVAPAPGSYVARAMPNNTFTLLAESAPFSTAN